MSAATPSLAAPANAVEGFLDAIERGRAFGWAWNRHAPEQRLEVALFLDGREIARGLAERARRDLRDSGIGDGCHSFQIALPEDVAADAWSRLEARALPEGGEPVALRRQGAKPAGATAGEAWPQRVVDALEALCMTQMRFQSTTQSALRDVRQAMQNADQARTREIDPALGKAIGAVGERLDQMARGLSDLRAAQDALAKQVQGLEVYFMRYDQALKALDARAPEAKRESKPADPAPVVTTGEGAFTLPWRKIAVVTVGVGLLAAIGWLVSRLF